MVDSALIGGGRSKGATTELDVLLMRSLQVQRMLETAPLTRQTLSLQICRVRRRILRRTYALKCEELSRQRLPLKAAQRRTCNKVSHLQGEEGDTWDKKEMA